MLTDLYVAADSPVHRCKPGYKLLLLFALCTAILVLDSLWALLLGLSVVSVVARVAQIPAVALAKAVRPALWLLGIIFLVQVWLADWLSALYIVLRYLLLIFAASLLTLTTRYSELLKGLESLLSFLPNRALGWQLGLAVALCLRFIPLIQQIFEEVRDAQKARGLERNWMALIVPTLVRTLKAADEIALAIRARN